MMALESKGVNDNLHILHPVFTLVTLVVWMVCNTHYSAYCYAYIYGTVLIQDYLTFVTFKTQFSETTCPIAMKLIHSREGLCRAYIPDLKQI